MRRHAKAVSAGSSSSISSVQIFSAIVGVAVFALLLGAAPAFAVQSHAFEAEVGVGELGDPGALAVDRSNGDLYVADRASGNVLRFDAAGNPANFAATGTNALGPFSFSSFGFDGSGSQIAVDGSAGPNAGRLYVIDGGTVRAFDSAGESIAEPVAFVGSACGVAVDDGGYIYVASTFGSFEVFDPQGAFLTQSSTPFATCRLALDSTGTVYGSSHVTGLSNRFTPSSLPVSAATTYTMTALDLVPSYGLAVDPADDNLFVNGNGFVGQYSAATNGNTPIDMFGTSDLSTGSNSVAIDRSGGANDGSVYASSAGRVMRFGPLVTLPGTTTAAASSIDGNTGVATLNGTVDPSGLPVTSCTFEYGRTKAYGQTVPCAESPVEIGSGSGPVSVHADLSGLDPDIYHFRLIAANENGALRGDDLTLGVPGAQTLPAQEVGVAGARLRGQIIASGIPTSYRFEYGTSSSYGSSAPSQPTYAGTEKSVVSRLITGLDAGTTYHYRVVATNSTGTVFGADRVFTTRTAAPSGRSYEQVSPVEKAGQDARNFFGSADTLIAPSGDAVVYEAPGSFGDSATSLLTTTYLARRVPNGWFSTPIDVPQQNFGPGARFEGVVETSPDLSHSIVSSLRALAPGSIEGTYNVYLRDNETGQVQMMFTTQDENSLFIGFNGPLDGNADFSRIYFTEEQALTPEAVDNGGTKLYEFSDGQLRLASVLPDGTAATESVSYQQVVAADLPVASKDGRRVFFDLGIEPGYGAGGLFMRENGITTPISVSQRPGDGPEVQPGQLAGISEDGNFVYFLSTSPLTGDSVPHAEGWAQIGDLYRYEVETGDLINLTTTTDPVNLAGADLLGRPVQAISRDGRSVYFSALGKLTPDAVPGSSLEGFSGNANLYVWRNGVISLVETGPFDISAPTPHVSLSPNGQLAIYTTVDLADRYGTVNPAACAGGNSYAGHCPALVFFDSTSGESACVSCRAGEVPPGGEPSLGKLHSQPILDDGRVFFNSPDRLVPADVNGQVDAYQWRDGEQRLISTGRSSGASTFTNASDDGRDVFFTTNERLVSQDRDDLFDLYDAREGGGIAAQNPAPPPPPCVGDNCLPPMSGIPAGATAASMGAEGAGNARGKRCIGVKKQRQRRAKASKRGKRAKVNARKKQRCMNRSGK